MAATMLDPEPTPREHSPEPAPKPIDLESTTDLHEEHTSDLDAAERAQASDAVVLNTALVGSTDAHADDAWNADAADSFAPGMILSSRFLLEDVLGAGGASLVYRARDIHASGTGALVRVALKTPRPELHDRQRAVRRLTHEFTTAQSLVHPHIVRVFELHVEDDPCFMTMELLEGKLLSAFLHDRKPLPGPLAQRVLKQCAQALTHAHERSVVHGDFKPDNVFVMTDDQVKIIDFGAATAPHATSRIPAGTATYASPEVLSGEAPDVRDDVFSFACVAYELLTGRHPFDRASSLQARSQGRIPPRAWTLSASQWLALLAAMSWRREQRPGNVLELANALFHSHAVAHEQVEASPSRELIAAELSPDLMPAQRSWGFIAFVACAAGVLYMGVQERSERALVEEPAPPLIEAAAPPAPTFTPLAPGGVLGAPVMNSSSSGFGGASESGLDAQDSARPEAGSGPKVEPAPSVDAAKTKAAPAPRSQISFDSPEIVTTEGSVAAVFVLKRSPPLTGRARVQWRAVSGSAAAGDDFGPKASGSVEFADGQSQRALYVPLRNDLLVEGDETFTVRLSAPHNAKVGGAGRATATIRDDDL